MTETIVSRSPRSIAQKIGLVLAGLLALANLPSSIAIGFEGSSWDPVVIAIAVFAVAAAIVTLVLLPFAWRGGRRSAITIIVVLALTILPALPAFFLPSDEVPVWGVMIAAVGILITVATIVLVATGLRSRS